MMLSRRICCVPPQRVTLRRSASKPTATYSFQKLQDHLALLFLRHGILDLHCPALPFTFTKEEASRRLNVFAAVLYGDKFVSSIAAFIFRGFGLEAPALVMGPSKNFVNISPMSVVLDKVGTAVQQGLEAAITSPNALQDLVKASPDIITDGDIRIRPAIKEELLRVEKWMHASKSMAFLLMMVESLYAAKRENKAEHLKFGTAEEMKRTIDQSIAVLESDAEVAEQGNRSTPPWWEEWKQQRSRTSNA